MKKWKQVLLIYAGIPAVGACGWLPLALLLEGFLNGWFVTIFVPLVTVVMYILLRKKLDLTFAAEVNAVILILLSLALAIVMHITTGDTRGGVFTVFTVLTFPFLVPSLVLGFLNLVYGLLVCIFATYAAAMVTCVVLSRRVRSDASSGVRRPLYRRLLPYLVTVAVVLLCGVYSMKQYLNRPEVRYAGHGFQYMHGYSSTDFTEYTVYNENSKLATLDHQPEFMIEEEKDMPVMDGAEACYPVYAAVAKAVYRNIDIIEMNATRWEPEITDGNTIRVTNTDYAYNGRIVSFTNTVVGFNRLLEGEVDLLFGARPSRDQFVKAEDKNIALTVTPIGREAFVFFVEKDNPIDDLTREQIRAIYHGEITNWKEVGGRDQKIKAFQRPKNSGSQAMMEYFMGDVALMEPDTYETISSMMAVIKNVAQYTDEDGAMGYSFRYFVEELNQEKDVKLLSIDGVAPTLENIENGSYPLTVDLCLVTRTNDPKANVQRMIDFMLSSDGQELVRKTGYAGLRVGN